MSSFLSNRPALPEKIKSRLPARPSERLTPLIYAGGMLAIGAALLLTKPRIGQVPKSRLSDDAPGRTRLRRVAQRTRDATDTFAPTNVTDSIGRSLLIGGVALLLTRVLDEAAGSDR